MPTVTLCACEVEGGGITDRYALQENDWPVVPREGEELWLLGNSYEVKEISHRMDKPGRQVRVCFHTTTLDFEMLLDSGWQLD